MKEKGDTHWATGKKKDCGKVRRVKLFALKQERNRERPTKG